MHDDYRGHLIRLSGGGVWSAELVERETGTLLPTKATATAGEGRGVCAARARLLVDRYLEAAAARGEPPAAPDPCAGRMGRPPP